MKKKWKKAVTIAITGVTPGSGVTHLAITLGNYVASKQRQKTAVVQVQGTGGIQDMVTRDLTVNQGILSYVRNRVTYYPACEVAAAEKVQYMDYDYVIYDICDYQRAAELYLHCDQSLILGSLKPWCCDTYGRFLRDNIINRNDMNQVKLYSFLLEKEEKSRFEKEYHYNMQNLPCIKNPWKLQEKDFPFLESICYR